MEVASGGVLESREVMHYILVSQNTSACDWKACTDMSSVGLLTDLSIRWFGNHRSLEKDIQLTCLHGHKKLP